MCYRSPCSVVGYITPIVYAGQLTAPVHRLQPAETLHWLHFSIGAIAPV